ncbi:GGDEF domain-containing protein [Hydrogenivirga caldilitoris]|nr:GGDEF domain-containing protein [Hydrogenivirga caldilitoris]
MRGRLVLKTGALLLALFILTVGIVAFFFRKSVIEGSEEEAMTIAELVRDTLTSYMVLNVIDRKDLLLEQIKDTRGLEYIRILRGEAVKRQFGNGMEKENPADPIEREVINTGKVKKVLLEDKDKVIYRLVIPYVASSSGQVNCLQCHRVKEGEVLGAISLAVDLTGKKNEAFTMLGLYTVTAGGIFVFLFLVIVKHFDPYRRLFEDMKKVLGNFKEGNFKSRLETDLRDEAGELAQFINMVGEQLNFILTNIREKVSMLIGYNVMETENALKDTEKIVEELVKISHFKRTIEQDIRKAEIYERLETILGDYMSLDKFSIYEVDERRNAMRPIAVQGESMWCSEVILENANECRAKRTGHDVDSQEFPCICPRFAHNELCSTHGIQYYCIPVNIGGKVGSVVQIVYEKDMDMFVRMLIPYIKGYLQEASPVLESKSLMELLQQQSYVDQLTGLYNRRFLEEIVDKLSAQIKRRGTILGILMVDIDYFKQVNDKYGHDVGDRVLKEIAQTIKNNVREADYVIRFGGEEIMVLLVDSQEGAAERVAEKIRQAVENRPIEVSGGVLKKTVSIGVSEFPKDCEGKFWQCVKFADVALYKAKEGGRNRVVRFTHDMWSGEEY